VGTGKFDNGVAILAMYWYPSKIPARLNNNNDADLCQLIG
jgi:hypothetical protein